MSTLAEWFVWSQTGICSSCFVMLRTRLPHMSGFSRNRRNSTPRPRWRHRIRIFSRWIFCLTRSNVTAHNWIFGKCFRLARLRSRTPSTLHHDSIYSVWWRKITPTAQGTIRNWGMEFVDPMFLHKGWKNVNLIKIGVAAQPHHVHL